MKKVFVVYNGATGVYGMPFVSDDVDTALKAVCSAVSPKDWATTLACSSLSCIAFYDEKLGVIVKAKKILVADASDLLNAAAKFSENVVGEFENSILILSQLKDFYTEVKNNDDSCTEEG